MVLSLYSAALLRMGHTGTRSRDGKMALLTGSVGGCPLTAAWWHLHKRVGRDNQEQRQQQAKSVIAPICRKPRVDVHVVC